MHTVDLRARHNVQVYGSANELTLVLNSRGRGDKHLREGLTLPLPSSVGKAAA